MINIDNLQERSSPLSESHQVVTFALSLLENSLEIPASEVGEFCKTNNSMETISEASTLIESGFQEEALILHLVDLVSKWTEEKLFSTYRLAFEIGEYEFVTCVGDIFSDNPRFPEEMHLQYCNALLSSGRHKDCLAALARNGTSSTSTSYLKASCLISGDRSLCFDAVLSVVRNKDKRFSRRIRLLTKIAKLDPASVDAIDYWGDLYSICEEAVHDRVTWILAELGLYQYIPLENVSSISENERAFWVSQIQFGKTQDPRVSQYALNETLIKTGLAPIQLKKTTSGGNVLSQIGCDPQTNSNSTKEDELASVIICTYNDEATLQYSVDSILRQTYENLELIIVDDASTSEVELQPEWVSRGVKLIRNDANLGPYGSRNVGVNQAEGAFVSFHDADDWAHPEKLERQIRAMREQGTLACYAQHTRICKDGKLGLENNGRFVGDGPITGVFRRSVFDLVGNFLPVRTRGDIEFRRRLLDVLGADAITELKLLVVLALEWHSNSKTLTDTMNKEVKLGRFTARSRKINYLSKVMPVDQVVGEIGFVW